LQLFTEEEINPVHDEPDSSIVFANYESYLQS